MELRAVDDRTDDTDHVDNGSLSKAVAELTRADQFLHDDYLQSDQHAIRQQADLSSHTQKEQWSLEDIANARASDALEEEQSNEWTDVRHDGVLLDEVQGDRSRASSRPQGASAGEDGVGTNREVHVSLGKRLHSQADDQEDEGEFSNRRRSSRTKKSLTQPAPKRTKTEKETQVNPRLDVPSSPSQSVSVTLIQKSPTDTGIPAERTITPSTHVDTAKSNDRVSDVSLSSIKSRASRCKSPNWKKNDNTGNWTDEQKALMSNLLEQQVALNGQQQSTLTAIIPKVVPAKSRSGSQPLNQQAALPPPQAHQLPLLLPNLRQATHIEEQALDNDSKAYGTYQYEKTYHATHDYYEQPHYDPVTMANVYLSDQHHAYQTPHQAHLRTRAMLNNDTYKPEIDPTLVTRDSTYQIDRSPDNQHERLLAQIDGTEQPLRPEHQQPYESLLHGVQNGHQQPVEPESMGIEHAGLGHSGLTDISFHNGSHEHEEHEGLTRDIYLPFNAYIESTTDMDAKYA